MPDSGLFHRKKIGMSDRCAWTWDNDVGAYKTKCNRAMYFEGCERDDGFNYCPYCGKRIEEKEENCDDQKGKNNT